MVTPCTLHQRSKSWNYCNVLCDARLRQAVLKAPFEGRLH